MGTTTTNDVGAALKNAPQPLAADPDHLVKLHGLREFDYVKSGDHLDLCCWHLADFEALACDVRH
jgi:hypothetical protein